MVAVHDYASCPGDPCRLCDAYADGWTQGKAKAFAEIRAVPSSGHTQDCGCRPCSSVRDAVRDVVGLGRGLRGKYAAAARRLTQPAEPQDTEEAESI